MTGLKIGIFLFFNASGIHMTEAGSALFCTYTMGPIDDPLQASFKAPPDAGYFNYQRIGLTRPPQVPR